MGAVVSMAELIIAQDLMNAYYRSFWEEGQGGEGIILRQDNVESSRRDGKEVAKKRAILSSNMIIISLRNSSNVIQSDSKKNSSFEDFSVDEILMDFLVIPLLFC